MPVTLSTLDAKLDSLLVVVQNIKNDTTALLAGLGTVEGGLQTVLQNIDEKCDLVLGEVADYDNSESPLSVKIDSILEISKCSHDSINNLEALSDVD